MRPSRRNVLLPLAALLVALAACATRDDLSVASAYDPLVRFPREATFAWDDAASTRPADPALDGAAFDALLKDAANEAFAARGYRAARPPTPYLLSYDAVVNTRLSAEKSKAVGSLSLELAESASGRRVWVGFARAEIHAGLTQEERRARLAAALERLLADFPPTQRPD